MHHKEASICERTYAIFISLRSIIANHEWKVNREQLRANETGKTVASQNPFSFFFRYGKCKLREDVCKYNQQWLDECPYGMICDHHSRECIEEPNNQLRNACYSDKDCLNGNEIQTALIFPVWQTISFLFQAENVAQTADAPTNAPSSKPCTALPQTIDQFPFCPSLPKSSTHSSTTNS